MFLKENTWRHSPFLAYWLKGWIMIGRKCSVYWTQCTVNCNCAEKYTWLMPEQQLTANYLYLGDFRFRGQWGDMLSFVFYFWKQVAVWYSWYSMQTVPDVYGETVYWLLIKNLNYTHILAWKANTVRSWQCTVELGYIIISFRHILFPEEEGCVC